MAFTKINAAGIGSTELVTLHSLEVLNNATVGGVLTYEDVTNVDSVGLITARNGIVVGSGITLSKDGDIFATGISTFGSLAGATIKGNILLNESDPKIFFNDGGSMISNANVANTLAFFSDGSNERVRIHSSGFVGIGTNIPNSYDSGGRTLVLDQGGTLAGMTIRASQQGGIYFADGLSGNEAYRGRIEYKHADDALDFGTAGTASKIRLDSSGRLLIGTTSTVNSFTDTVQIFQNTATAAITVKRASDNAYAPYFNFIKSRGSTNSAATVLQSGDVMGYIRFSGTDGTDTAEAATIQAHVDGTPGDNDMPGRLVFYTTADGSQNATERLRIDSQGRLLLGTNTARAVGGESNPVLHIEGSGNTSNSWVNITRFQSTTAGPNLQFAKARSNTPGTYTLVQSGDTLGTISFLGADGTDMANYAATIKAQVDGTAGSNDMPGRLVFSTTADGGTTATERMRIDSNGHVTKPHQFHIEVSRSDDQTGYNAGANFGTPMIFNNVVRTIGTTNSALDTSTGKITVPVDGVYFLEGAAYSPTASFQQAWFTDGSSRMNYSDNVHACETSSYNTRLQTV